MLAVEKKLLDFSPSFPKDLQRKIELAINKKSDKCPFSFFEMLLSFISRSYDKNPNKFLHNWWKEMRHNPPVSRLGDKAPRLAPWDFDETNDLFDDGNEMGGEFEKLVDIFHDDELWKVIYTVYLNHDGCGKVFWDVLLKELGQEKIEDWITEILSKYVTKELPFSGMADTPSAVVSVLNEVYDEYSYHDMFTPVEVNGGRKFHGLVYIISRKQNFYRISGHSVSTTVYSGWDPIGKRNAEFNCDYNLFYYAKNKKEYERCDEKFKRNFDLNVDISDEEQAEDFKTYFMDLINRAKAKCGTDYRYMKNYINVCTNKVLGWDVIDKIINVIVKGSPSLSESQKITLTIKQLKRLIKESYHCK